MAKTSLHTHTAVARLPGVSYRLSCSIFMSRQTLEAFSSTNIWQATST